MAARQLSGFQPGEKVSAHVRASDVFTPGLAVEDTGKADQRGSVGLKLKPGVLYWVKGENDPSPRTVLGKGPEWDEDASLHRVGPEATARRLQADREAQAAEIARVRKSNPLHGSPAPGSTVEDNTPKRKTPSVAEPQPHPRQDEFSGPQRSDTPDGQATPKDPGEHVPAVPQEAVPKSAHQRSSTETGVAAIKDPNEQVPALRQEDASGPQRSDTETGSAAPKPKVPAKDAARREDSSANAARGNTADKTEEATTRPPARQTTKTGTRKRASSKSKK